ncbi:MAG: c-type heme family protein [Pirellulales bacterium]
MGKRFLTRLSWFGGATAAIGVAFALCGEPVGEATGNSPTSEAPADEQTPQDGERLSVARARERAKLMHNVYVSTLEMLHDRYFHTNRAVVPARAMEDVFAEMARQSQVASNWISVNTRAMSIGHEPKTEFEKKAAQELAAGKDQYEVVEDGLYRRAGPVPLSGGCISCHAGFGAAPPKSPRFAGLVIAIPVKDE